VVNDSADVTSSGRSFHVCGPATGKARLPTVESLLAGTGRLVPTERSDWRLGRSATRVNCQRAEIPQRKSMDVFVKTAILNWILSGTRSQ